MATADGQWAAVHLKMAAYHILNLFDNNVWACVCACACMHACVSACVCMQACIRVPLLIIWQRNSLSKSPKHGFSVAVWSALQTIIVVLISQIWWMDHAQSDVQTNCYKSHIRGLCAQLSLHISKHEETHSKWRTSSYWFKTVLSSKGHTKHNTAACFPQIPFLNQAKTMHKGETKWVSYFHNQKGEGDRMSVLLSWSER